MDRRGTVATKSRTNIKRFLVDWAAVPALLVCFIVSIVYKGNSLMSTSNMVNTLRAMVTNTVSGIVVTITMASDGSDISAGTLASCSTYVFVSAYLWLGQSLGMSTLICILTTLVMYQLTMFLIFVCKTSDMLATCAPILVHQGIGQWYIGGGAVSTGMKTSWGAAPIRIVSSESFSAIGRAPWIIIIMLGCVLVAYLFLNSTKHGRHPYAMDGNKEAAKLSGVDVKKYRCLADIITAVLIAIGSIPAASRGSSAQVMCCDNYLMPSLTTVLVGCTVDGVEKPNVLGTMIGAMLASTLENGLTICAVPFYALPAVKGFVLALTLIAAYAFKKES